MMTSAMTSSAPLPPAGPNGLGLAPNSGFRLITTLRYIGNCGDRPKNFYRSQNQKKFTFPGFLLRKLQKPTYLSKSSWITTKLRNSSHITTIIFKTCWDLPKNFQINQKSKISLSPEIYYETAKISKTQITSSNLFGSPPNFRNHLITSLYSFRTYRNYSPNVR